MGTDSIEKQVKETTKSDCDAEKRLEMKHEIAIGELRGGFRRNIKKQ